MKNILITGHKGFVGSNLTEALSNKTNYNIHLLQNREDIFHIHESNEKYDHIIHLAAKTSIPESWNHPHDYLTNNFISTSSCLEYCRRHQIPLTFLSTCLYTGPFDRPVNEEHPVYPSSPYGFSKLTSEQQCEYYIKNLDTAVTVLRPFNLYGPRQNFNFVIPHILRQIVNPHKLEIEIQTLTPKRDFLYISDLTDLIELNLRNQKNGIFNVGTGSIHSVENIIDIAQEINGTSKNKVVTGTNRKIDHSQIICDNSKTKNAFNWSPKVQIKEGLERTLKYFESIHS